MSEYFEENLDLQKEAPQKPLKQSGPISLQAWIVYVIVLVAIYFLDSLTPIVPDGLLGEVLTTIVFAVLANYGILVKKQQ